MVDRGGVVLASGSPRRSELLGRIIDRFETVGADLDERALHGESPEDYVERLAVDKAVTVALRRPGDLVVGADTTVVLDGEIIGKPASGPEARRILRGLSGRTHTVLTAVALVRAAADGSLGHRAVRVESTRVTFARVEPAQLDAYVASREPEGKAGAYALQGLGAALVESIEGDPTTVIGLPLRTTALMLAEAGHDPWPGTRAAGAPLSW